MEQAGRTVQTAMLHTAVGAILGGAIEGVMPPFKVDASLSTLAFETLVQAAFNGLALNFSTHLLVADDPTFGILFSGALLMGQPQLNKRLALLSEQVRSQVHQGVLQMAPLPAAQAPAS